MLVNSRLLAKIRCSLNFSGELVYFMDDYERVLFGNNLHAVGKVDFAKGKRPLVECILCSVRDDDPKVKALKIYTEKFLYISLNLYPYNPGHLMIVPTRHVESFEELSDIERNRIFEVTILCQKMLRDLFSPKGFNVGYNEGSCSGASIKHIHIHIVPRYDRELGFIDIIGTTRIIILNAIEVMEIIKPKINEYIKA